MWKRFLATFRASPIIGIGAVGIGLGLVFLPFVFASTEKAAEFWGSFFAAITGAGALLAGAWYQDKLSRRQKRAEEIQEILTDALALFLWLGSCLRRSDRVAYRFEKFAALSASGHQPKRPMNYGTMRAHLQPVSQREVDTHLPVVAKLPVDVASEVFGLLDMFADDIGVRNPDIIPDDEPITEDAMRFYQKQFVTLGNIISYTRGILAEFLVSQGIMCKISAEERTRSLKAVEEFSSRGFTN
jgi:hypothetical protein